MTSPRLSRRTMMVAAMALVLAPKPAMALSMMDPFNMAQAMDSGVAKVGDNVPYADGLRHRLDVYAPEQRGQAAPVVYFIYGGGWSAGSKEDYQFVGRALAARGFVTVIADYRLFPEVRYPDFLYDCASGLKWVQDNIANYGGDPTRLFLAGHSAGAYNAVMLALDPTYLREFGVTLGIRAVAAISGPYDFYPFEYGQVTDVFGQAPRAEGTQPINLVTSETPPMLLATGTFDPIVRMQNSENLAGKLREQGVWVTEKYYEGFGHMEPVIALGAMWRWRMPVLDDMVEFFSRFGAFPSGVPRLAVVPDKPEGVTPDGQPMQDMDRIIQDLDRTFSKIAD